MADATAPTELVVFTVTPEAIARILELREAEDEPAGLGLRIEVTGTRASTTSTTWPSTRWPRPTRATPCTSRATCRSSCPPAASSSSRAPPSTSPPAAARASSSATPTGPTRWRASTSSSPARSPRRSQQLLEQQINPALAAHGGFAALKGVEGTTRLRHDGRRLPGLRRVRHDPARGHRPPIREAIPEVTEVVDTTDHDAGENPYYDVGRA